MLGAPESHAAMGTRNAITRVHSERKMEGDMSLDEGSYGAARSTTVWGCVQKCSPLAKRFPRADSRGE